MTKDPAFLFYSKDFYESTRTMLPEERACYVDLLIYQHQNGHIPEDVRRVQMYCSGIDQATLQAVLEAKFKLTLEGWYNPRLRMEMERREEYSTNRSDSGLLGQFYKKARQHLSQREVEEVKTFVVSEFGKDRLVEELRAEEGEHEAVLLAVLEAMLQADLKGNLKADLKKKKAKLEAKLKHIGTVTVNENKDEDEGKGGMGGKQPDVPELQMPWGSERFKEAWGHWLAYKREEFGFRYKSVRTEQAALSKLQELSGGDEEMALKVMLQSMGNGWKGFFKLKDGEKRTGRKGSSPYSDTFLKGIADGLRAG